jgi:hypothetical protein
MSGITIADIEEMFEGMQSEAGWDTSGPLVWGYFFSDPDEPTLFPLAERLRELGFGIVDVYPSDDASAFVLHVERVEAHSPESLHRLNQELDALAADLGVESYDGIDAGPVEYDDDEDDGGDDGEGE